MNWVIFITVLVGGLFVGSFLNVVIYRGPAMWRLIDVDAAGRGTFIAPPSRCPQCNTKLRLRDLAPIISFLFLKGKCAACGGAIPIRYPVVEALGAVAAITSFAVYGWAPAALLAAIYLFALIALAFIDLETGYLPDAITLPLIAGGLLANVVAGFVPLDSAAIGAIAGFAAFWLVAAVYQRVRGREGLGGGDAKLLAAIGAWGGWAALAPTVLIAAAFALAWIAMALAQGRRFDAATPLPFGPALCAAAALMILTSGVGWRFIAP